ncbi:hypothetical protein ARZXY2_4080 [Arthrobacter sp. ZXY-2]|nr:hypothetical protein ARZXY2_4080 [Arthrobacter sp. ZXY-2]
MLTTSVLSDVLPGPLDLEHDAHVPTGRHHVRDPVPWDLGLGGPTGSSDGLDNDRLRAQVLCALAGAAAIAARGRVRSIGCRACWSLPAPSTRSASWPYGASPGHRP